MNLIAQRSVNFEMSFWCLQSPPKNERKQVDLSFYSSKVEFIHPAIFWRKRLLEKIISTFSDLYNGIKLIIQIVKLGTDYDLQILFSNLAFSNIL